MNPLKRLLKRTKLKKNTKVHWCNLTYFKITKNNTIEINIYSLKIKELEIILIFPDKFFQNFNFKNYSINFLEKKEKDIESFKELYHIHINFFREFKDYFKFSNFLKFENLFEKNKKNIPNLLILPKIKSLFKNENKISNKISNIIKIPKKTFFYEIVMKIENLEHFTFNNYYENITSFFNIKIEKAFLIDHDIFKDLKKKNLKNFILLEKKNLKLDKKKKRTILILNKININSQGKYLGIKNLFFFFENKKIKTLEIKKSELNICLQIPKIIKQFFYYSEILIFLKIFEIHPINSFEYFNKIFIIKEEEKKNLIFLGESILKLITSFFIFINYNEEKKENLDYVKKKLNSDILFSQISEDLGLHTFYLKNFINFPLFENKNIFDLNYELNKKNLSDIFKKLIGSIFYNKNCLFFIFKFLINFTNIFLHNPRIEKLIFVNMIKKKQKDMTGIFLKTFLENKKWKEIIFDNIYKQSYKNLNLEIIEIKNEKINLRDLLKNIKDFFDINKIYKKEKNHYIYIESILNYKFINKSFLKKSLNFDSNIFKKLNFFGQTILEFLIMNFLKNKKLNQNIFQKFKKFFFCNFINFKLSYLFGLQKIPIFCSDGKNTFFEYNFIINYDMSFFDFFKLKKKIFRDQNRFRNFWMSLIGAVFLDGGFYAIRDNFYVFLQPLVSYFFYFHDKFN